MLTPQTMAVITRTFPAASRGQAMALWGATAGVAILVGPVVGGLLVDGPGWEWIFFINVPVGVVAFVLASRLVPRLETHSHTFDWIGVALSAVGMFLLVFGVQEGETYDWGTITGFISVPLLIAAGLLVLGVVRVVAGAQHPRAAAAAAALRRPQLLAGQHRDHDDRLLDHRDGVPVHALRPGRPGAVAHRPRPCSSPRWPSSPGAWRRWPGGCPTGCTRAASPPSASASPRRRCSGSPSSCTPTTQTWVLLLPMALMGVGNAFMWGPLGATATRNLPLSSAGAGSGVYNTTRQVGAVLGSAAIAAVIQARLAADLPGIPGDLGGMQSSGASMPAQVADGFASAMSESMLLPAAVLVVGVVAVLFFERPASHPH